MSEIKSEPGTVVGVADKLGISFEIVSWRSLDEVEVKNLKDGTIITVKASKLSALKKQKKYSAPSFDTLTAEQKILVKSRYEIIKHLFNENAKEPKEVIVKKLTEKHRISRRTLYEWLMRFRNTGLISSLVDKRASRGSRKSRLSKRQLSIIDNVARKSYETPQKLRLERVVEKVMMECQKVKIGLPGRSAIIRHIKMRDPLKAAERREGRKIAHDQFGAIYGKFPSAEYPLAVVQIDHTKLDIELVDDKERLPIGRPNITLAMDVFSRVITGFFVSFENSSLLTTGLCLEHAMFPKDEWLQKYNIKNKWPVWGKPACIHVDNALEFRSHGLKDFCEEYGVTLEYRPVKTPHYGGHVERVFGTIKEQVHTLPGTTFSNIKQKGEYPSEKKAVITLAAFQKWLGEYITGGYLKKIHSGIGMTPLDKWAQGIHGTKGRVGVGAPPILADRETVRNLLLPTYERSIQRDGIRIDGIQYFSSALHTLFLEKNANKKNNKVTIKRDPRDISEIKVLERDRKQWFTVPYRDITYPSISLWEWQAAVHETKKHNKQYNERNVFHTYHNMQRIVEEEEKKTKSARRKQQLSKDRKNKTNLTKIVAKESSTSKKSKLIPAEKVKVYKSRLFIN